MTFKSLIYGFDTIECAYYLGRMTDQGEHPLDFEYLAVQKEILIRSKVRKPLKIKLGCEEFLLASHGTSSGYPYLIQNDVFIVEFGELNKPNFFVKYRSIALWHYGAFALHERFLKWAASVGMQPYQPERLSRVDVAFDYFLPEIDFDQDNFVTSAKKDKQYRLNRTVQTFNIGEDQIVFRMYNKTDEVVQKSNKTWLYKLWGIDNNVWRVEFQVRKQMLRHVGIQTLLCLEDGQGDLMRLLVTGHTSLRVKSNDSNRSRWAIHPLWQDLVERVNQMQGLGVISVIDQKALLEERLKRMAISVYGYVKRIAAIDALYTGEEKSYMDEAFAHLQALITEIHDPLTWQQDVNRRVDEMRLSE
ncbi:MAG: hypothetical protein WBP13_07595 [Methylophilaceae bacterium]